MTRFGLAACALAASALVACATTDATEAEHEHGHHGGVAHGTAGLAAAEPSGHSIFHLADVWRDQADAERTLAMLRGRPHALTMVYLNCAHACPRLLLDMKRLEAELGDADVGFVLVSIDPQRDTPAQLASFAAGADLDPERWTLLTGGDHGVRGLAALLGIRYRPSGEGEFTHSNVIAVLDADGVVVHRQVGLGEDPAAATAALRRLLR
jgi:protein SCO1